MNKTEYYVFLSETNHYHEITENAAKEIIAKAENLGINILTIESEEYPDSLRLIDKPPLVLYCLGDISLLKTNCVAIVGTRRASPYGKWVANRLGRELVNLNVTHVSGMAWGIDSISHEAVINNKGKSIAVLGTGVDVCFPKSSKNIYDFLKVNGLIVSEYPPGTAGLPQNFPERNRIISGLSSKVIVVEGAQKSGSLITAKYALDQGKDVYAVPGNINQPNSIGTNLLIMDGAIPIVDIDNLGSTLGISLYTNSKEQACLSISQAEIVEIVKSSGSLTIEEIASSLDMPIGFLLSELAALEIKGVLTNENGIISL